MLKEAHSKKHQQETDFLIVKMLLPFIESPTFLDIGAEKGTFAEFLIEHDFKGVFFEPFPQHEKYLQPLAETHGCRFLPFAIHDQDEVRNFYIASDQEGKTLDYFHSLQRLANDSRIVHNNAIKVTCRSLNSLLKEGLIEKKIGIIKTDTEGNDLKVLRGMSEVQPEILVTEYFMPGIYAGWAEGNAYDLIEAAKNLGFEHFIAIKRLDYLEIISVDVSQFIDKQWGNLIFIRDELFKKIPAVLKELIALNEKNIIANLSNNTNELKSEIKLLRATCDERLQLIKNLHNEAHKREVVIEDTKKTLQNFNVLDLQADNKPYLWQFLRSKIKKVDDTPDPVKSNELIDLLLKFKKTVNKNSSLLQKEINILHDVANERLKLIQHLHYEMNNSKNIKIFRQLLKKLELLLAELDAFQEAFNKKSYTIPPELNHYTALIKDIAEFNSDTANELRHLFQQVNSEYQHQVIHTYQHRTFREHLEKFRALLKSAIAPKLGTLMHYPPRPLITPHRYQKKTLIKNLPSISIVTPAFNQGNFLERTIESIILQNYPALEYIIQDGGSEDRTLEILERYKSHLKHWESTQDEGQSHALNLGFSRSSGEIMAYLNSDDLLLPGSLHYIGEYFAKHPEVDVIYGHRILIDENNQEIGRWVLPYHDSAILSWADYIPQETLFWRRTIWNKVGGKIDESFRFAMDWDLILRFRDAGAKFVRLPRFLGAFRIHPDQKTSTYISNMGLEEMNRIRARCHGRATSFKEVKHRIRSYLYRHIVYHRLYRAGILRY